MGHPKGDPNLENYPYVCKKIYIYIYIMDGIDESEYLTLLHHPQF